MPTQTQLTKEKPTVIYVNFKTKKVFNRHVSHTKYDYTCDVCHNKYYKDLDTGAFTPRIEVDYGSDQYPMRLCKHCVNDMYKHLNTEEKE